MRCSVQANALQEKTESESKAEATGDDDSEEYDPESEPFDLVASDHEDDYRTLASKLSITTFNPTAALQEEVYLLLKVTAVFSESHNRASHR